MMEFLTGYKTYIIGVCLIIGAVGSYLSGDTATASVLIGMAATALGVRDAIAKK